MASNSFIPSYMQTKEEDIEEEEKEIFLSTVSPSPVEIKEEETLEKETDVSSILPSYIKNSPIETDEDVEKVSFKERSAFGWEQEQQILSNIGQMAKAYFKSAVTEDLNYDDALKSLEAKRQDDIYYKFPQLRGITEEQKFDAGVLSGQIASGMTDPVFYMMPFLAAEKRGKLAVAGLGAAVGVGEAAIREKTLYGEVNPISAGIAGVFGGSSSLIGYGLNKWLRGRLPSEPVTDKIEPFLEESVEKTATSSSRGLQSVSPQVQEKVRTFGGDVEFDEEGNIILKELSLEEIDNLEKATHSFVQGKEGSDFANSVPEETTSIQLHLQAKEAINKSITALRKERKKHSANSKKYKELTSQITTHVKELKTLDDEFFIPHLMNHPTQQASANMKIIEKMKEDRTLTNAIFSKLVYENTRPIVGALGGFAYGYDSESEDDMLLYAAIGAGVSMGYWSKAIENSTKLSDIDKQTGELILNAAASRNLNTILKTTMAGPSASKLDSLGGWAETIGRSLFSRFGDGSDSIEAKTLREQAKYNSELSAILKDSLDDSTVNNMVGQVLRGFVSIDDLEIGFKGIVTGGPKENILTKGLDDFQISEVKRIVPMLEQLREQTKKRVERVGINFKDIDDYGMPQLWNLDFIKENQSRFLKDLAEAVEIQTAKNDGKGGIDIEKFFSSITQEGQTKAGVYGNNWSPFARNENGDVIFRNLADFFENERELFDIDATKLMAERGWLNLHAGNAFRRYGDKTIKVTEFADVFGPNSEVIDRALRETREAFVKASAEGQKIRVGYANSDPGEAYQNQFLDSIEAYWGVYDRHWEASSGPMRMFTAMANSLYLTTASVSALTELMQPFVNTSAWNGVKTLATRSLSSDYKFSKEGSFTYDNTWERELSALIAKDYDPYGAKKPIDVHWNNAFFKLTLLDTVTKIARNFAYDAGINRMYSLSKKFNRKGKLSLNELNELERAGITDVNNLSIISKYKNAREAFDSEDAGELLNIAGRKAADRDAIIPLVGNRRLFTQSRNPVVRSTGQFLSWSQAKSAQLNSLIRRVEDGDAKLAIRALATIPIAGAVVDLKATFNPFTDFDKDDEKREIGSVANIAEAINLSAGATNWQLSTLLSRLDYGIGRSDMSGVVGIPVFSMIDDWVSAYGDIKNDLAVDDYEGVMREVMDETPGLRQGLRYYKNITGDDLIEDIENKKVELDMPFAEGGAAKAHVVPNAKEVSEDMIDKSTGLKFSEQAEGIHLGSESNLLDALKRRQYGAGGLGSIIGRKISKTNIGKEIEEALEGAVDTVKDFANKTEEKLVKEFDDITKSIEKGKTPEVIEENIPAPPSPSSPLEIGVDESLVDGSKLKNYSIKEAQELDSLVSTSTAGTKKADKLILAPVEEGTKAGVRLNLNSKIEGVSNPSLSKLQTVHKDNYSGRALSYAPYVTLTDVLFSVNQKGRAGIASKIKGLDVPEAKSKFPAMSVDGSFTAKRNVLSEMGEDVTEVGINPAGQHLFIDLKTGQAVKGADVATVIGDRVYAKGVTYWKKTEAPKPVPASDGTIIDSSVRYKFKHGGLLSRLKRKVA
jgi:hypothetical protein